MGGWCSLDSLVEHYCVFACDVGLTIWAQVYFSLIPVKKTPRTKFSKKSQYHFPSSSFWPWRSTWCVCVIVCDAAEACVQPSPCEISFPSKSAQPLHHCSRMAHLRSSIVFMKFWLTKNPLRHSCYGYRVCLLKLHCCGTRTDSSLMASYSKKLHCNLSSIQSCKLHIWWVRYLCNIAREPHATIAKVMATSPLNISFRRALCG
jgi:hypothetical protein